MADNDKNNELEKWKGIVRSGSDVLDKEIKRMPREVVMELARDPVLGPRISEAINRALAKPEDKAEADGEKARGGASVAAAVIKARQEKLDKEQKEEQEKKLSLVARIAHMDIGAKAKLAREGDSEARSILIKEGNKMVALSVLSNPKITIQEIEKIAASRNVSDEILREIAKNKDWVNSYAVVLGLVNNPKTPVGISLTYLPKLLTRDIRMLAKSKSVPEVIRMSARKMAQKRAV